MATWLQVWHSCHASALHRGYLTGAGRVGSLLRVGREGTIAVRGGSTAADCLCSTHREKSRSHVAGVVGAVLGVGKGLSGVVIRPLKGLALSGMDIGSHAVDAAVLLRTKRKETFLVTKEIVEG